MKIQIERYIETSLNVIDDYLKIEKSKNSKYILEKEFKGYISSLGASIIMSGLIPTLAVYSDKEKVNRLEVMHWVKKIIIKYLNDPKTIKCYGTILNEKLRFELNNSRKDLFQFVIENRNDQQILQEEILNIAVALKLALRTFELSK